MFLVRGENFKRESITFSARCVLITQVEYLYFESSAFSAGRVFLSASRVLSARAEYFCRESSTYFKFESNTFSARRVILARAEYFFSESSTFSASRVFLVRVECF